MVALNIVFSAAPAPNCNQNAKTHDNVTSCKKCGGSSIPDKETNYFHFNSVSLFKQKQKTYHKTNQKNNNKTI